MTKVQILEALVAISRLSATPNQPFGTADLIGQEELFGVQDALAELTEAVARDVEKGRRQSEVRKAVPPSKRDPVRVAQAIVCRLGDEVRPRYADESEIAGRTFVARVLREEGCTSDIFRMLDEEPQRSSWGGLKGLHGQWHHHLRFFRNTATRNVFAIAVGGQS